MSIKLHLPSRFYYLWEGKEVLDVTGKTVAECLDDLIRLIPLMKKALSYGSGVLDPEIKVLVNHEGLGAEGLARKVNDGDEIHFVLGTA
jgi:molybdopterin converting factor small subunit